MYYLYIYYFFLHAPRCKLLSLFCARRNNISCKHSRENTNKSLRTWSVRVRQEKSESAIHAMRDCVYCYARGSFEKKSLSLRSRVQMDRNPSKLLSRSCRRHHGAQYVRRTRRTFNRYAFRNVLRPSRTGFSKVALLENKSPVSKITSESFEYRSSAGGVRRPGDTGTSARTSGTRTNNVRAGVFRKTYLRESTNSRVGVERSWKSGEVRLGSGGRRPTRGRFSFGEIRLSFQGST